jgi:hypothetical protein
MKCATLIVLCCTVIGSSAEAMDKPPLSPARQGIWLRDGLVADMEEMNKMNDDASPVFPNEAFVRAKVIPYRNRATRELRIADDDVGLLADYYFQTRAQAEEELQQFQGQLAGGAQGGWAAKAAPAGRDPLADLDEKLAAGSDGARNVAALIYLSLPGYSLRHRQVPMLPNVPGGGAMGNNLGRIFFPMYGRGAYGHAYHDPRPGPVPDATLNNNPSNLPPVQLPTWFPHQPSVVEWNRWNAALNAGLGKK